MRGSFFDKWHSAPGGNADRPHRRYRHATVETVEGTHFFPMERPDLVRDAILDAAV